MPGRPLVSDPVLLLDRPTSFSLQRVRAGADAQLELDELLERQRMAEAADEATLEGP